MTDATFVDYMLSHGYDFDIDDGDWKKGGRSALEVERELHGDSPYFKGFEKAYSEVKGVPGYWSGEMERMREVIKEKMDDIDSLKDLEGTSPEDIMRAVRSEFSPLFKAESAKRGLTTEDLKDRAVESIRDDVIDKYYDIKRDVDYVSDKLTKARTTPEFEEVISDIETSVGDLADRTKVRGILKGRITKAESRIVRTGARRELLRILTPEDIRDTGIGSVQRLADVYGFDRSNDSLQEIRDILSEKGAKVEPPAGKYNIERFKI